jgi:hypothetical protein
MFLRQRSQLERIGRLIRKGSINLDGLIITGTADPV